MSSIKKKDLKYNLHSWSAQGKLDPIVITKAEGIYFWDEEGKRYADMSSQLVNSIWGMATRLLPMLLPSRPMSFHSSGHPLRWDANRTRPKPS